MKDFNKNNSLRDFIFGANDGLAISLVLMAGISAAITTEEHFLYASVLILLWVSLITSLSIYSAGNSELKTYKRKLAFIKDDLLLLDEIKHTRVFMSQLDLDNNTQELAIQDLENEREQLLLAPGIELPFGNASPFKMATTFFGGFIIAGLLPLITFRYYLLHEKSILISLIIATPFLFLLGYKKGNFTGISNIFSALSFTIITLFAAIAIYMLTGIFS